MERTHTTDTTEIVRLRRISRDAFDVVALPVEGRPDLTRFYVLDYSDTTRPDATRVEASPFDLRALAKTTDDSDGDPTADIADADPSERATDMEIDTGPIRLAAIRAVCAARRVAESRAESRVDVHAQVSALVADLL